jgi:high-affinity K+ transport system ATPase subunit B
MVMALSEIYQQQLEILTKKKKKYEIKNKCITLKIILILQGILLIILTVICQQLNLDTNFITYEVHFILIFTEVFTSCSFNIEKKEGKRKANCVRENIKFSLQKKKKFLSSIFLVLQDDITFV